MKGERYAVALRSSESTTVSAKNPQLLRPLTPLRVLVACEHSGIVVGENYEEAANRAYQLNRARLLN
jgi:hypothetical protein